MATRLCISSVKPQLELQHRDTKEKSWSRHYFVDNQRKTMKDLQLYYTVKWYIHIYIYMHAYVRRSICVQLRLLVEYILWTMQN